MANLSSLIRGAGAALLITALTACGGGAEKPAVFELTGNDQMQFSAKTFQCGVGKLTINFKNAGTLPKEAMGHNVVVLKPGSDPVKWALGLMEKGAKIENDYLPEAARGDVLGHTKILGPGESETLEIEFKEPGKYPYVCTFAGHATMMNGVITVK